MSLIIDNTNCWQIVKLDEVCYVIDSLHKTPNYSISGYPMVRVTDIKGGYLDLSSTLKVDKDTYCEFTKKHVPQKNNILMTRVGTYGVFSYINTDELFCLGQNTVLLNPKICNKFLYYQLISNYVKKQIEELVTGSTQKTISLKSIKSLNILLPPLQTQKQIAKVLSSLDDKIELNNRINENLERQAQAIFKSWFVDFEPFGGVMPGDWELFDLEKIAVIDNGYSYKGKELQTSDIAMATIKNFDRNGGFKLDGFKEIIPSEKIKQSHYVQKFDILVAHTDLTQNADIIGNAELLLSTGGYKAIIASMDLVKVTSKNNFNQFLLATLLKSKSFKAHSLGYVNGTTVLHLNKKALKEYSIYLPKTFCLLDNLSLLFEKLYLQMAVNIEETQKLTQLRDTLLPRLMRGEIDVQNVEV